MVVLVVVLEDAIITEEILVEEILAIENQVVSDQEKKADLRVIEVAIEPKDQEEKEALKVAVAIAQQAVLLKLQKTEDLEEASFFDL